MKHHPLFYYAGRHGRWASCSCGWISRGYHGAAGPQLEFGRHLISFPATPTTTDRHPAGSGITEQGAQA